MRIIFPFFILALNFLTPGMASSAESFGRLFTTPAERANLDYLRKTTQLPKIVPDQPTGVEAAPELPSSVSVEGYVKRGDGKKGTVWVNRVPMQEGSTSSAAKIGKLSRDGNQIQLKLPGSDKNLSLKAGQIYDPETGNVSEINAHARQTTKDEAQDSGTIGETPGDTAETGRR